MEDSRFFQGTQSAAGGLLLSVQPVFLLSRPLHSSQFMISQYAKTEVIFD